MRGTLDYSDLGHLVGLKSSLSGNKVKTPNIYPLRVAVINLRKIWPVLSFCILTFFICSVLHHDDLNVQELYGGATSE